MIMATQVEGFRNRVEELACEVSNVDTKLRELEMTFTELRKSLDSTLLTLLKAVGLSIAVRLFIRLFFLILTRTRSIMCDSLEAFVFDSIFAVSPLIQGYLNLTRTTRDDVHSFLISLYTDMRNVSEQIYMCLLDSQQVIGVTDELHAKLHDLVREMDRMACFVRDFRNNEDGVEAFRAVYQMCMRKFWRICLQAVLLHLAISVLFCLGSVV